MEQQFLTYKGKPFVRSGNTIYYGNMSDKYVIMFQILTTKDVNGLSVADKVTVSLMLTDPEISIKEKISKKTEKNGLWNAMDVGIVWLERALKA